MDPATIATVGLSLLDLAWGAAKSAGLAGSPDVVKYADAGLFIARRLVPIIQDALRDGAKYATMTPAELVAELAPATWDDIEAEAKRQLAEEG